jgi:hypothetical protein
MHKKRREFAFRRSLQGQGFIVRFADRRLAGRRRRVRRPTGLAAATLLLALALLAFTFLSFPIVLLAPPCCP